MNFYIINDIIQHCLGDIEILKIHTFIPHYWYIDRENRNQLLSYYIYDGYRNYIQKYYLLLGYIIHFPLDKVLGGDCLFLSNHSRLVETLMTSTDPTIVVFFFTYLKKYYETQRDWDAGDGLAIWLVHWRHWKRYEKLVMDCLRYQIEKVKDVRMTSFLLKLMNPESIAYAQNWFNDDHSEIDFTRLGSDYKIGRCSMATCHYPANVCTLCQIP